MGETPQRFSVLRGLWQFYNGRGAYQTAREVGEQCLQLAQQGHDTSRRGGAATVLWMLGYPDQARRHLHATHALAQELMHPPSLAFARMLTAIAYQLRRETDAAHEQAEALIALATEQGFALFLAIGGILRGGTTTALGQWG